MNIAFFGSSDFSASILNKLNEEFGVSLVVTQPDKPIGRKKEITPTPVKKYALKKSIPVKSPASMNQFIEVLKRYDIDVGIVAAYGNMLPKQMLITPNFGFINVHYSLLPKYRGASPVHHAILNGDRETGVSIIKMSERLDQGDIIVQKKLPISDKDTTLSLIKKLTELSIPLLIKTIKSMKNIKPTPQNHKLATYTKRLAKADAYIPYERIINAMKGNRKEAEYIYRAVRAFTPWPVAWTRLQSNMRLKLLRVHLQDDRLIVDKVQVEGKKESSDLQFINILFGQS